MFPINTILSTAFKGFDKLFTSDEERLRATAELRKVEAEIEKSLNEHMTHVVNAQKDILSRELSGGSFLAKNWRPALMVIFSLIIGYNHLILPLIHGMVVLFDINVWVPSPEVIPDKVWTLLQIGVGGYIVGRSGEKIADKLHKK